MLNYSDQLDVVFQALSDPTRRYMVEQLSRAPASVSELARPLPVSLPAVVQHLQVLEASGLVRSEKVGRVRTCRIDPDVLTAAQSWIDRQKAIWEQRFDRLEKFLQEEPTERIQKTSRKRREKEMTAQQSKVSVHTVERDFVLTRIIEAPRDRVFKAWTNTDQFAKWWGPRQYPARCEGDFRVGGSFRLVMVGPDGKEYPMTAVIKEIKAPERLVWLQDCSEHPLDWHEQVNKFRPNASGNIGEMLLTITFEEFEGKTKMTVTMHFDDTTDRDALVNLGMTEGWSESFEKLEEMLAV